MQSNWHGLVYGSVAVVGVGVVIYLAAAMQRADEVKIEQKVQRIETKIDNAKFDDDFSQAWDGKKLSKPSRSDFVGLKKELEEAKAKQKKIDADGDEMSQGTKDALKDIGDEMSAKSPANSPSKTAEELKARMAAARK